MEELVESYGDTANQEKAIEPSTPQRPAAEVFQFIAERRKSLRERERMQEPERLYPYPVSRFSSCSSECTPHHTPDRLSAAPTIQTLNSSPGGLSDTSHAQIQTATLTRLTPIENPLSRSTDTLNLLRILTPTPTSMGGPNGPRPAPGSDFPPASQALTTPRVQDKTTEEIERYPAFLQCQPNIMTTNDPYTRVRPRRQYRCPSQPDDDVFSVHSSNDHHSEVGENDTVRIFVVPPKQQRKASNPQHPRRSSNLADKENTAVRRNERKPRISASKVFTPPTPPNSSRRPRPRRSSNARSRAQALLEVRQPNRGNGSVPSPASSSELSPVGKDMMANLRKQRQRSRDDMKVPPRSLRR